MFAITDASPLGLIQTKKPDASPPPGLIETRKPTRFELACRNGFTPHLQPAGNSKWKIAPTSRLALKPESISKTPAILGKDGLARGLHGWSERPPSTDADCRDWQKMEANVSLRLGKTPETDVAFGAVDIDCDDPELASQITELAFKHFGRSKRRVRPGSPRALMLYRLVGGAETLGKIRTAFTDRKGRKQAVEILLHKCPAVILGMHAKGPLQWPDGFPHADEPPEIDPQAIERFRAALRALLEGE